jgi:hypothetical protein
MTTTAQVLEEEIQTYEALRAGLLTDHEGEFVLIKGHEVLGLFHDWQSAYTEGQRRFGFSEPMLVHRVVREEPVYTLPTILWPALGDV